MINNELEVALSYQIAGAQLLRGDYYYDKKLKVFITKEYPKEDKCLVRVKLNNAYCTYHMSEEARPDRSSNAKAHSRWRIMTPMDRLKWHIVKYAYDCNAIGNIKFQVT